MAVTDPPELRNTPAASPAVAADTVLWERLCRWIEAETGMDCSGTRLRRLQQAWQKIVAEQPMPIDPDRLLARPCEYGPFLERLTAALTVGESFFFRNEHHFRALRDHVIPQILRDNAEHREIRVWSAGCAAGEEPYSVAILLDQILGDRSDEWRISILGTDLNPVFLERARRACYRAWSFRQTDIQANPEYFSREGDAFHLVPRVREHVRFAYLNLVKDVYPSPMTGTLGLDLILFRNVAIYLKPEVTWAILERFHRALRSGGWLLLGETELSLPAPEGFEVRRFDQAVFYQKAARTPRAADDAWAPPWPVLTTGTPASPPAVPTVPSLPEWLPLPQATSRFSPPSEHGTGPISAVGGVPGAPAESEGTVWSQHFVRLVGEGNFEQAEHVLTRIADRKARAELRLRYARALFASAETARAREMIVLALNEDPLLIEAQLLSASIAEEAGDLPSAEAACRRALYIDRSSPMAHFHLALVQQQKGDWPGTERSLRTTLKLVGPREPQALVEHGEGICYGRLKEMASMILEAGSQGLGPG